MDGINYRIIILKGFLDHWWDDENNKLCYSLEEFTMICINEKWKKSFSERHPDGHHEMIRAFQTLNNIISI